MSEPHERVVTKMYEVGSPDPIVYPPDAEALVLKACTARHDHVGRAMKRLFQDMDQKLKENDHKGSWTTLSVDQLIELLYAELKELIVEWETYKDGASSKREVQLEVADVANFALMIHDVVEHLGETPT